MSSMTKLLNFVIFSDLLYTNRVIAWILVNIVPRRILLAITRLYKMTFFSGQYLLLLYFMYITLMNIQEIIHSHFNVLTQASSWHCYMPYISQVTWHNNIVDIKDIQCNNNQVLVSSAFWPQFKRIRIIDF